MLGFLFGSAFGATVGSAPPPPVSSIISNFNNTPVAAGKTLWFNSVLNVSGLGSHPVRVSFTGSNIRFTANGTPYSLNVPDAVITFSPTAASAATKFDPINNQWVSTIPSSGLAGNTFLTGLSFPVPSVGFPGGINPITWQASFSTDTPGVTVQWQWSAAVYSSFSPDYSAIGVKPVNDNKASTYQNSDQAGTPENFKTFVIGGATGGGGSNFTGSYSATASYGVPLGGTGTFLAFGPTTYVRSTGQPITVSNSFKVSDPTAPYILEINNSGVSSAVVTLNGVEVAGPSDFNPNVTLIARSVTLGSTNELDVELRGKPGTSFTIEIIGIDNVPPTITATVLPPPNAAGWNNSNIAVTFTCFDATSGVAFCPPPVVVSMEGAGQVISGTAKDNAGNTATASITINLDKTPPTIVASVSPPPNAAGWISANATVSFTCSDATSGIALCPAPVAVSSQGTNQVISGTARDKAGNAAIASVILNIDKTPPTITAAITPAANAAGWNNSSVTVTFTCSGALSGINTCPGPVSVNTEGPIRLSRAPLRTKPASRLPSP